MDERPIKLTEQLKLSNRSDRYASVFGRSLPRPKGSGDEASIAARLRTILNGKGEKFSGQLRTDAFILVLEEYVGMIPGLR
jgi:hypothetical protein